MRVLRDAGVARAMLDGGDGRVVREIGVSSEADPGRHIFALFADAQGGLLDAEIGRGAAAVHAVPRVAAIPQVQSATGRPVGREPGAEDQALPVHPRTRYDAPF